MRRLSALPPVVKVVIVMMVVLVGIITVTIFVYGTLRPGPEQPVPFSHRIHAQTKQISCLFCHQYATRSSNAGIPPVDKCLLCHNVIASNWRPIAKVRAYARRNEPIPWVRVARVPDFTHFRHQPHLTRGFDCSRCHGNVRNMDRIRQAYDFSMNFCVTCHRQNNAPIGCYTCHY